MEVSDRFVEALEGAAADIAAAAGEHGDMALAMRSAGFDPDMIALLAREHTGRSDSHPPAHTFQVAILLGAALERRLHSAG